MSAKYGWEAEHNAGFAAGYAKAIEDAARRLETDIGVGLLPAPKWCVDAIRTLATAPPEPAPGASDLEAMRRWFDESGNAEFWSKVECIECELGRPCLKSPKCAGAEPDEPAPVCGIEFSPFGMPAASFIKSAKCTLPAGHIGHHKWTSAAPINGPRTTLDGEPAPVASETTKQPGIHPGSVIVSESIGAPAPLPEPECGGCHDTGYTNAGALKGMRCPRGCSVRGGR